MIKGKKEKKSKFFWDKVGGLRTVLLGLVVALLVTAIGTASFFYGQWQRFKNDPVRAQEEQIQREVDKVVKKVGKLMILPEDERPTLVVVDNKEEIKENQEFFRLVEDGDKMLIYRQARKAILYRPSSHKIVNVAPINIDGGKEIAS